MLSDVSEIEISKMKSEGSIFLLRLTGCLLLLAALSAPDTVLQAEISDRVAAFVDDIAITLSEFEARYTETVMIRPGVTREEVLKTMVNRVLLLREARKIRLEAPSEDELLRDYIDLKIRAFIRITEEEIMDFYNRNAADFQGKELDDVREEIENYLTENELNKRLKWHIDELGGKACVRILL
jgi:hypothetical protein